MKDYYALLGLPPDCEAEDVKLAFRKLAQQYHPDVGGEQAQFLEIREAYEVLIDPDRRAFYDIAFVENFPGYSLVDADTGEDLEVEYEDEPAYAASDRVPRPNPRPNPRPDNGRGLMLLVVLVVPILGFGFGMVFSGDPLTALGVSAFTGVATFAVALLLRENA